MNGYFVILLLCPGFVEDFVNFLQSFANNWIFLTTLTPPKCVYRKNCRLAVVDGN